MATMSDLVPAVPVAPVSDGGPESIDRAKAVAPSVATSLAAVRARIKAAGGNPARITVVAVTKGFGPEAVRAAIDAGITDLGDNYAQELLSKVRAAVGTPVRWHFLGPVQRNKVAALAAHVDCWHSVDRVAVGEAIARRQPDARVLVQVNATGESTKHGCRPEEVADLVAQLRRLPLDVAGLMAIGPTGPAEAARPVFRLVAELGHSLGLAELSMGMTGDLEVAIQEGATMVRIGRGLFGPRDRKTSPATVGS
jgi:pyridoxal phosphate enzyme (YggS family)